MKTQGLTFAAGDVDKIKCVNRALGTLVPATFTEATERTEDYTVLLQTRTAGIMYVWCGALESAVVNVTPGAPAVTAQGELDAALAAAAILVAAVVDAQDALDVVTAALAAENATLATLVLAAAAADAEGVAAEAALAQEERELAWQTNHGSAQTVLDAIQARIDDLEDRVEAAETAAAAAAGDVTDQEAIVATAETALVIPTSDLSDANDALVVGNALVTTKRGALYDALMAQQIVLFKTNAITVAAGATFAPGAFDGLLYIAVASAGRVLHCVD